MGEAISGNVIALSVCKNEKEIRQMIHIVRNQQVMLDSSLTKLYQVETRVLSQTVRRNSARSCFQLTKEAYANLKSQIVASSVETDPGNGYGGRRK